MSQNETIRPEELGIPNEKIEEFKKITKSLTQRSTSFEKNRVMSILQQSIESGIQPDDGLDETYQEIKINLNVLLMMKLPLMLMNGT